MIHDSLKLMLELMIEQNKKNSTGPLYTGEEDLLISADDFDKKIRLNADHLKYITVLKEQGLHLRGNKLFSFDRFDEELYLLIPNYDLFITALDMYSKLTMWVKEK